MSAPRAWSRAAPLLPHPNLFERRLGDLVTTGLCALIPAALALAIMIELPYTALPIVLAAIAGLLLIVALIVCRRLEVTATFLLLYLALFDGPVKLFTSQREVTATLKDFLILAVSIGVLARIAVRRERIEWPPLWGWVAVWVLLVLVNAFNPKTQGVLAIIGGFSQQLQFVPFFFIGYSLMRSTRRFRQLFIIMGVVATASGIVAAYQSKLSPTQLSSWGPGYADLIHPQGKGGARVFFSGGEARVRPPGLGSEAGASGGLGHVALPMCLALVAISRGRKKWIAALLSLGSILAVVVGLGRTQLVGAALGVVAFGVLVSLTGRQLSRTVGALLVIVVLAIPVGAVVASQLRSGTFKRYESLSTSSGTTSYKENAWSQIPEEVAASPLGFGLGNSGAFAGRLGTNQNLLEGHGLTSETQYNVLVKELGAPGLLLWPALSIFVSLLIFRRIRRIRDNELALCLAGALAGFIPLPIEGSSGFISGSLGGGAYYWFAIGVVAYWLAGPSRAPAHEPVRGGEDAPAALA